MKKKSKSDPKAALINALKIAIGAIGAFWVAVLLAKTLDYLEMAKILTLTCIAATFVLTLVIYIFLLRVYFPKFSEGLPSRIVGILGAGFCALVTLAISYPLMLFMQ